ncbi:hypothetical protein AYL99_03024 [Fonsecaea erecta]|uniref:BAH domain-containing protein n=1 Tax=Fonsecaea erecta TaxID=1367422 RepID=A0A178ZVQ9_9EURO|nr:hypothetical protein AYL99_03024 [Fonsecaea erecta]OAP63797.1 hypothetical protein AYL99_03024 [Fonsecaea erecta]
MASALESAEPMSPVSISETGNQSGSETDGFSTSSEETGAPTSSRVIGRKRKAGEMEGDCDTATQETSRGSGVISEGHDQDAGAAYGFTVTCPISWRQRQTIKSDSGHQLYVDHPLGLKSLRIEFLVEPGAKWTRLSRFKSGVYANGATDYTFCVNDYVLVNRHTPPRRPLPEGVTDEEELQWLKDNFWVALIAGFHSLERKTAFVRLWWLYWPEELPMGRQPYHGRRELLMSNKADIVEMTTISNLASVCRWEERDEREIGLLNAELFWRQTYNLNVQQRSLRALSKLKRHCVCKGYDNPDREMYVCSGCGLGNHEACLIAAMEQRAWQRFKEGTLTHENPEEHDSSNQKTRKPSNGAKPWAGKLEGKISRTQRFAVDIQSTDYAVELYHHAATIQQLVPQSKQSANGPFQPVVWNMNLDCLRCGAPLNERPV